MDTKNQSSPLLDKLWNQIDKINEKIGLKRVSKVSQIDEIINLSLPDLKSLENSQCAEYAFMIAQHGLFVQRELNTVTNYQNWIKKHLRDFVDPNQKREIGLTLEKLNIQFTQLQYVITRLEFLSKAMSNLSFTRRSK